MRVFISHSSTDKAQFSSISLALKGSGIDCWDPILMEAGGHLATQLRRAVAECGLCVFVATKNSVESRWCLAELGAFWGANKRVIVYLADADVKESDLPVQFQGNLWTDDALVVLETIRRFSAERQVQLSDTQFRTACCKIVSKEDGGQTSSASGYLIRNNAIATIDFGEKVTETRVFFGDQCYEICNQVSSGEGFNVSILELSSSPGADPAPIAVGLTEMMKCAGFGFTNSATFGFPFSGELLASDIQSDDSGITYTVLSSPSLARIETRQLSGLAGAPVWASGAIFGSIHSFNPSLGLFYLTPAERFLPLLDRLTGRR